MKKKIVKIGSLLSLVLIPVLVLADDFDDLGIIGVLMMHLMLSLHSAGFLCLPASLIFKSDTVPQKTIFWKVFWIRAIIVIILSFVAPETSIVVDVASIFIGGFIGFPMTGVVESIRKKKNVGLKTALTNDIASVEEKCSKCGTAIVAGNTFCTNCGQKVTINELNASSVLSIPSGSQGKPFGAAKIFGYNMTEEQMVEDIIKREIDKTGETANVTIAGVERRKNIFAIVYAIILMICLSLYFFHSHTAVLIIVFIIVTVTYFSISKNYNLMKYLKKEVKARPDEKIGYIVSTVLSGKISGGTSKVIRIATILIAIAVPMFIFRAPHVIYEKDTTLDGYVVRFYTLGWLDSEEELEIPEEYKGEPVVGIRGDVFANVNTLRKIVLPETIKEIRGGAFKGASNLEEINLPEGIPEIKGETFQECVSLKEIVIPDSVTRIGGHAFRDNHSLEKVEISAKSQLQEIGSSAFRNCYELEEIYLPRGVNVNEKAFKDSGTNVKEYSTSGVVYEDEYAYKKEIYIPEVGIEKDVFIYDTNAETDDFTLELDKVEGNYGDFKFVITYRYDGKTQTFTLSRSKETHKINNDLLISIDADYVFNSYRDRVTVFAYYN